MTNDTLALRNFPPRIFEADYVQGVLGLEIPLNESSPFSESFRKQVIEEQLQLEGFFSDFKKLGGDAKNSALALRYIMEDPGRISEYIGIIKADLEEAYSALKEFLDGLIESISEIIEKYASPTLDKILDWAEKTLDTVTKLVTGALSAGGWKGAMVISGALVGIGYLWSMFKGSAGSIMDGLTKAKSMIFKESYNFLSASLTELFDPATELDALMEQLKEDSIPDRVKKAIDDIGKTVMDNVKKVGPKVVAGLAVDALSGALTGGIGTAFSALQKIFGGAKVVFQFLGEPLAQFVDKIKNPKEEEEEAMAGEDDPTEGGGKDKKEESIRRNGSVLSMSESQLRFVVREALTRA